jgi:hypothetical protein
MENDKFVGVCSVGVCCAHPNLHIPIALGLIGSQD